jgi:hypothetical protein
MASSCNPRDRRRSERVVLGMRVTVLTEDQERRRRQCEAMTQVLNARGGLWKPQNNAEQACRVVRVDHAAEGAWLSSSPSPHRKSWPVVFPPEDWIAQPLGQARKNPVDAQLLSLGGVR